MKIAVVGYGNIGKSLEKLASKDSAVQLTAIVSRRRLDNKLFVPWTDVDSVDADVALLALGSYDDIERNVFRFAKFHTVDCFDTHEKLAEHKRLLNVAKPNKISLCATGWDPGILSIVRAAIGITGTLPVTQWGKGISQGHSNALRSIPGVLDAVSVTLPATDGQKRICYVACVNRDKEQIADAIRNMPHYFKGQNVELVFCTTAEVRNVKNDTEHAGQVFAYNDDFEAQFRIQMKNNCDFTARIMLAYAKIVPQLEKDGYLGALDPLDLPLKYLVPDTLV